MYPKRLLLIIVLFLIGITSLFAQDKPQFKTGDKIEVKNMSSVWVKAKILEVVDWRSSGYGWAYRVEVEDINAPNRYWNAPANSVRTLPNVNPVNNQDNRDLEKNRGPDQNANGVFTLGDRVDTYYDPAHGHNRGTVIQVGDGRYKVHYNGCASTFDEWVDRQLVKQPNTISANAPEITFLMGKWSLVAVTIGKGNVIWGFSPGIQFNTDGTYTWYEDFGKPPVKGKWRTDAKVPGLDMGTPKFDGIVIKDAEGIEWKAFRWKTGDNKDAIEIDHMCSNGSKVGSRM